MLIIPTTGLKKDYREAEDWTRRLQETSRWIQVDVGDGVFKEGKTFELELLRKFDFNTDNLLWDIHLMVKEPINWVEKCKKVGATRIIGQVEIMRDREEFLEKVKKETPEAGLAFDIETPIDKITGDWDIILLMARPAGFGYFPFDTRVLDKIKKVKDQGYVVGIDGGADLENIEKIEEAGADIVYSEVNYWKLIDATKNK
ncbi:hypothetical protein KBC75_01915 [Candidatus Shapirobacteria bacterium]|nr:hypothetical protein [Candidatus Shapirobacteria bacterium]